MVPWARLGGTVCKSKLLEDIDWRGATARKDCVSVRNRRLHLRRSCSVPGQFKQSLSGFVPCTRNPCLEDRVLVEQSQSFLLIGLFVQQYVKFVSLCSLGQLKPIHTICLQGRSHCTMEDKTPQCHSCSIQTPPSCYGWCNFLLTLFRSFPFSPGRFSTRRSLRRTRGRASVWWQTHRRCRESRKLRTTSATWVRT